jgi:hypothetical protein
MLYAFDLLADIKIRMKKRKKERRRKKILSFSRFIFVIFLFLFMYLYWALSTFVIFFVNLEFCKDIVTMCDDQ